ncbi:RagB/SusD family nutrient uptake outer membrane protein [Marinilabiliaceae bacterium JC040]|nr:RagB/SusD family nutrient uptake outer membrane protein [Marinilabiliaceae bacterium JC040]
MKSIFKKIYIGIFFMSLLLTSCDEYLDDMPSKTSSVQISTIEHLDGLLASYRSFYKEPNNAAIYGSDDYGIPMDLYNARPSTFYQKGLMWYLWDVNNLVLENSDYFFSGAYSKIFTANTILEYVDKVKGSAEDKARLKAEAHFIRAYENWNLVNTYCLPYASKFYGEFGLPRKTSTSYEEPMVRMSLKATYDFIEEDLQEALKSKDNTVDRMWRGNAYAIKAFMARYLLFKGDYNNALKYANEVLAVKSDLVDYNTEMHYGKDLDYTINGNKVSLKMPYTHDEQMDMIDIMAWKEFIYLRVMDHGSWWYVPSKELLDLYDHTNDLRYKYHIVEDYSYDRSIQNYSYPGYVFFYKDRIPSGMTTANLILIKAECLARTGKIQEAMNAVNILRAKRMLPGSHVNLSATTKDEAILKVLAERRREMPFSIRWFDIRRFNYNKTSIDDVVLKRKFYSYNSTTILNNGALKEYTLPEKRYAAPLTDKDIFLSNDQLKQNKY